MLNVPLEDLFFLACALAGGVLLLVDVTIGDPRNAIRRLRIAGLPAIPMVLAFMGAFGLGGLFATHVPDAHGVQAMVAAAGVGVVGVGLALMGYGRRRSAGD